MSRILIFAGPTLSSEQIYALVPDAEIYPPIAGGDLIRLAPNPGDLVVIIDGFFYQSTSVRHKEILDLLRRGIHVWGAASMGALRAAELFPFGMRGFGRIFEAYVRGEIEGDDEVAVLHAPQDMGYTNLSEALVNVRYACDRAVEARIISDRVRCTLIEVAASLPFYERSYQNMSKHIVEEGLSQQEVAMLLAFRQQEHVNLKQQDALELLQAIHTHPLKQVETSFEWHETSHVQSWRMNEQGMYVDDEQWIFDTNVLTAYQLFGKDYPDQHYRILFTHLARIAAQSLDSQPFLVNDNPTDIVARYVATRSNLCLGEELPASIDRWLRPAERSLSQKEQLARIAVRVWFDPRDFDWREALIQHLKTTGLFHSLQRLVIAAFTLNKKLWGHDATARCYTIRPELVSALFQQRWHVTDADLAFALLDRGFRNAADFFNRACFFYLLEKYIGSEKMEMVGTVS